MFYNIKCFIYDCWNNFHDSVSLVSDKVYINLYIVSMSLQNVHLSDFFSSLLLWTPS